MAPPLTSTSTPRPTSSPFLVFEGLDGSGKSTLIQLITQEVQKQGFQVVLTREPGGTPLAEEIRGLLLRTEKEAPVAATELLLYAASRAQHVARVIQPAIAKGDWVICDRFTASTVAFQCFARGLARQDADWLNTFAVQGTTPDLTILLDLTVDESARRQGARVIGGQSKDRMESEPSTFHESVRQGYLAQAKENPASWLVLDATKSPEQLREDVVKTLRERGWLA